MATADTKPRTMLAFLSTHSTSTLTCTRRQWIIPALSISRERKGRVPINRYRAITFGLITCLLLTSSSAFAVTLLFLDTPHDNFLQRADVKRRRPNAEQAAAFAKVEEQLGNMIHNKRYQGSFPATANWKRQDYCRPLAMPSSVSVESTLATQSKRIVQVGEVGCLHIHSASPNVAYKPVSLYLRVDTEFVPITEGSHGTIMEREQWEADKLDVLRKWIEQTSQIDNGQK